MVAIYNILNTEESNMTPQFCINSGGWNGTLSRTKDGRFSGPVPTATQYF